MVTTDKSLLKLIDDARHHENQARVARLVAALAELGDVSGETAGELVELLVQRMWVEGRPAYWSNRELWHALAALPDALFIGVCGAMQEAATDRLDEHQAAASFFFSLHNGRPQQPSKKTTPLFRARCLAMAELASCPEQPTPQCKTRLRKVARQFPQLDAQVKSTVLACLDELRTSRPVDRGLVLWLAVNS